MEASVLDAPQKMTENPGMQHEPADGQLGRMPSILLVDDDPAIIQFLSRILLGLAQVRFALSGTDALAMAMTRAPDLVLVDAEMPGMSGFALCAAFKDQAALAGIPVIIVTSHIDTESEVAGFAAGAADFIRKPPVAEVVRARVSLQLRLKALTDALRDSAMRDGLTGLANRRLFDQELRSECERARRSGDCLALLMVDVDYFKRYNDEYGHVAGDDCLRRIASALQRTAQRPADSVARYGGEEFALLLPDTDLEGAAVFGRAIVDRVAELRIPHLRSPMGRIATVSVGVTAARRTAIGVFGDLTPKALVEAADQALYCAKSSGRGRCCVHSQLLDQA